MVKNPYGLCIHFYFPFQIGKGILNQENDLKVIKQKCYIMENSWDTDNNNPFINRFDQISLKSSS